MTGKIKSYKLLCEYYPIPREIIDTDTEVWLSQQILQPEDKISLFVLLLVAERFGLCDTMIQRYGNQALYTSIIPSQKAYDFKLKHYQGLQFADDALCAIPDINAELLEGKELNSVCIELLFENRRFDILRKQKVKLNSCSNVGQALYFRHRPFNDLYKITNKDLLTHALNVYKDRIDWDKLCVKTMAFDSVSPILVKEFAKRNLL